MKYLLLLLLTLNSYAEVKFTMMDLRSNSSAGYDIKDTQELAIARLVEIAKIKKGWRTGTWNLVQENSLYSKVEDVYTHEDQGQTTPIFDDEGSEIGTQPIMTEVVTPTTFYYHPLNWSYAFSDANQEVANEAAKEARKLELKNKGKNKTMTFKEFLEYKFD